MITQEQREARKDGIFASDVGRIMLGGGVLVALEKMGKRERDDFEDDMEINIGWKSEPLVLSAYEQRIGVRVQRDIPTERHSVHGWLGCHRDASWSRNVEAKTVGMYNRHLWGDGGDEVPDYVLWQVQAQMAVSGHTVTDIPVCFVSNLALKHIVLDQPPPITIYQVPKDYVLEDYLIYKSKEVWDCIQEGITPPPRNSSDVLLIYPKAILPAVQADEAIYELWKQLLVAEEERKEAEKKEAELKFKIQSFMTAAEALILTNNSKPLVTWKNDRDTETLDKKLVEKRYPEVYKECLVPKLGARKFLIKRPKQ